MINYIENDEFLKHLVSDDFFALKIKCLYNSYGFTSYTEFFNQGNNAYIARLDDSFILYKTAGADDEELRQFLSFHCVKNLLCSDNFTFDSKNVKTGYVMKYKKGLDLPKSEYKFNSFCDLKKAYELMASSFSDKSSLPSLESFLSSITHSLNKKTGIMSSLSHEDRIIAFAFADISDNGAIISNVAVDKDFRKRRIGSDIVNGLIARLCFAKNIFLQRDSDKNMEFYNSLGFEDIYKFTNYTDN